MAAERDTDTSLLIIGLDLISLLFTFQCLLLSMAAESDAVTSFLLLLPTLLTDFHSMRSQHCFYQELTD